MKLMKEKLLLPFLLPICLLPTVMEQRFDFQHFHQDNTTQSLNKTSATDLSDVIEKSAVNIQNAPPSTSLPFHSGVLSFSLSVLLFSALLFHAKNKIHFVFQGQDLTQRLLIFIFTYLKNNIFLWGLKNLHFVQFHALIRLNP